MKPVTETTHVEERYMYQCIVWGMVHNSLWEIDTLVKWDDLQIASYGLAS